MSILQQIGEQANVARYELQSLETSIKNNALKQVAHKLCDEDECAKILEANKLDLDNGIEQGMSDGLLDRLRLTKERIHAMSEGLLEIVELEDPIGEVLDEFIPKNGLKIQKKRVPLGVIGMIYESRPNVTVDAFGLCFKAGNAVILKGGSDAIHSNIAIANCIRTALDEVQVNPNVIQLIEDPSREITNQLMRLNEYIDVLIPRGGAGLIKAVVENSTVPVIETGTGNCHIYIDKDADLEKAIPIIINAKTQRVGVCNACESLVVHKEIADLFLPMLATSLKTYNVEIRGDEKTCVEIPTAVAATDKIMEQNILH